MTSKNEMSSKPVRLGQILIHLLFIFLSLTVILPLVLTIIVSFSSEKSVMQYGYSFFPAAWSLDAYKFVFSDNSIFVSYGVTAAITVIGTVISVFLCSLAGYVISRSRVKYRNVIAMFLYIPTIVGAGLIPWYYNIKEVLHLANTLWVLILPSVVSAYNIFLIRNYYKGLPEAIVEAAEIDGAGPLLIFVRIMFPLALPITATVTLFVSLGYWNDWYLATWFIDAEHQSLYPLQYYLFQTYRRLNDKTGQGGGVTPTETVYLATMFVTMGPIILVYPFVQKYFIKGLTLGGVKG